MNLGDALALIGMKVAWMQYADRLMKVERESLLKVEWADDAVALHCDEVYADDGKRWSELGL